MRRSLQNRREAGGEEDGEDSSDGADEKDDGDAAGGLVVTDLQLLDARDCGHEDDGKETADVEDQQLFLESPGEGEQDDDSEEEEDVAAGLGSGFFLVGGEVVGRGVGQPGSPIGADVEMQIVCASGGQVRECGV